MARWSAGAFEGSRLLEGEQLSSFASVTAVILAGGQGTRFWPLSRAARPKQFLRPTAEGESLIQATAERVRRVLPGSRTLVVTGSAHVPAVTEHLPGVPLVVEPCARNTAAAIGLAALAVRRSNPKGVMLVLPSDHAIDGDDAYRKTVLRAVTLAEQQDLLVTIGLPPRSPHTGYGYIERGEALGDGQFRVRRFVEKPTLARAEEYVAAGTFLWNSGQFAFRAEQLLRAIERHMPELARVLAAIDRAHGTPRAEAVLNEEFAKVAAVSIDYGVMERHAACAVVEALPFQWSDIGSWEAWAEYFAADTDGNVLQSEAIVVDSRRCLVHAERKTVGLVGVDGIVIVDTPDALLVCARERAQDVKKIVDELKARKKTALL